MKRIFIASSLLLPMALTGCKSPGESQSKLIDRPTVEITDSIMTPEVLEAFGRIGEPVASPDGKTVAYTLTYEDVQENKGNSEIYLVDRESKKTTRLTRSVASESNLQWISGGERIAFLKKEDKTGKPQVCSIKADGSDFQVHSSLENGVECFLISPDDAKIVFGSPIDAFDKDSTLFEGLPKTTGRVVDDLMYKHWDEWVTQIPHPFVADFKDGKVENAVDIMAGEPFECPMRPFGGADAFAWAPDSKSLVYVSRKLRGQDYAFSTDSNLYLYDLASGDTKCLTQGMAGYDTDPAFSPDGSKLAFLSMKTPKYESDKKRLMVLDMASGEMRDLTAEWRYWPEAFAWRQDGSKIVFTAYCEGVMPVFEIGVGDAAVSELAEGQWDYVNASPLPDGNVIAMRHSMVCPNEIVEVADHKVSNLTDVNKELLSQLKTPTVEKVMVPTSDGKEMTSWLILPPDFDPTKKYPAILYCQGGPQQAVSQFWSYRWNFFIMASHGYVVIAPNRRGVPGFGEEWNAQISGDYGGQNMRDYFAATDFVADLPYVDEKKVGAIGASYGGFSVYWLAGHNDGRYAALVAHAGIFNLEAQYLETEEMWFADYDLGGPYWDKSNATAANTYANSPHLFTDRWSAPILVTVGELDYRILASQGMMAFNAAKMHGLETEMLVFPDENHWVLKPQNAILWQRVFFRFLDKYLK